MHWAYAVPFPRFPFRFALKVVVYFASHANAEAKPQLLAQCIIMDLKGVFPVSCALPGDLDWPGVYSVV